MSIVSVNVISSMHKGHEAQKCESNQRVHICYVVKVKTLVIQLSGSAYIVYLKDVMVCK